MSSDHPPGPAGPGLRVAAPADPGSPTTRTGRGRHARSLGPGRWPRGAAVCAGVTFVAVTGLLAAAAFTDGDTGQAAAPPRAAAPADSPTGPAAPSGAATPPPGAEQSISPVARAASPVPQDPDALIAGIRGGVAQLVDAGQLDAAAARELDKRLGEVARALADGKNDKARNKLTDAAAKVESLRAEGRLTPGGHELLGVALNQLAAVMPGR